MIATRGCAALCGVVIAAALAAGCGKKGPPLPPLIRIPQAPADFTASRRASTVDLQFVVPSANTDGSKPANVERVDVYGFTGSTPVTDEVLLKNGTKVGSVAVKAPRDPDAAVEPDEQDENGAGNSESDAGETEMEATGLDQGSVARLAEPLTAAALAPTPIARGRKRAPVEAAVRPLLGPSRVTESRTYLSVGINTSGRRGALSKRVAVPLVPPPPAPGAPAVSYDEKAITVTWTPPAMREPIQTTEAGVLPSRILGLDTPAFTYNVYDGGAKLTGSPLDRPEYTDTRIEWGARRCYAVRTVETIASMAVESLASPVTCETLKDTFPPAAPTGLTAVASPGAVSLIWQPNTESDLAGYLVLRAPASGGEPERLTPQPIQDATFKDTVAPGGRYVYRIEAVDKAGNVSAPSAPVEETSR